MHGRFMFIPLIEGEYCDSQFPVTQTVISKLTG